MGMEDNTIELRDITLAYGRSNPPVLDGVNITIGRGSIYGLLGPSGRGKTTILKVILSLLKPDSGTVVVRCKSAIPGPGVGLMPQNVALHLYFSVSEILHYYSLLAGLTDQERADKQETILSFLNLSKKVSEPLMFLSGGQQRRLSLACALMASPPILILDEPTVGTDPVLRHSIWSALRQIAKGVTTVLLTTHYLEEAGGADSVGFLREGKILQEGKPADLLDHFSTKSMERLFLTLCYNAEIEKR